MTDARRVTQLAEALGFDLADAFAGDLELLADFFQGAGIAIHQAEAEFENLALALGEAAEDILELAFEEAVAGHVHRILSLLVFDEVAKVGFVTVAHR